MHKIRKTQGCFEPCSFCGADNSTIAVLYGPRMDVGMPMGRICLCKACIDKLCDSLMEEKGNMINISISKEVRKIMDEQGSSVPVGEFSVEGGYLRLYPCEDDADGGISYTTLDEGFNIITTGQCLCFDEEDGLPFDEWLDEPYDLEELIEFIDEELIDVLSFDPPRVSVRKIIRPCTEEEIDKIEEARENY